MLTREKYIVQILDGMACLRTYIEAKNGSGYYDSNKYAENFYAGLLNRIYGWNLENANEIYENAPGIDLIDVVNQIVVQVSTTNTTTKIHKTIGACRKYPVDLKGYHLIMLFIIGKKEQYRTEFDAEGFLGFDKEEDIWDNQTIIKELQKRTTSVKVLRDVCDYLNEELTNIYGSPYGGAVVAGKYVKDCTEEYVEKWSKPLFLDHGETSIRQKDLYIPPTYSVNEKTRKRSTDEKERRSDILAFLEKKGGKLVVGHPGIGKTTLLVYFLNCTEDRRKKRVCRLADFASRDECKKWKSEKRYAEDRLLEALGVSENDLKDTVLLLDGLDEMDLAGDDRIEFLNQLSEVFDEIPGFTWIVTCRTNYIDTGSGRLKINHAILNEWNQDEIENYIRRYASLENADKDYTLVMKNTLKNHEVLGIPLILYMVLASGIPVDGDISLAEVYNRIFNLEQGGIYEKIIDNQKWDRYPNATVKEKKVMIHKVAQEIAFWIFENNPEEAAIPQREYQKILIECGDSYGAFGIGSYFQMVRHTEGTNEMCFVHRSMYEYFAIDYLIHELKNVLAMPERKHEEFWKVLAHFGKKGKIWDGHGDEPLIYQFLKVRMKEFLSTFEDLERVYLWSEESMLRLIDKGILRYAYKDIGECRNVLQEELNCGQFVMLLLRIVYNIYNPEKDYKNHVRLFQVGVKKLEINRTLGLYLRSIANDSNRMMLDTADLDGIDLGGTVLQRASLCDADLNIADLTGADLYNANLKNADIRGAFLKKADLSYADLKGADLREAFLNSAQMEFTDLSYSCIQGVYLRDVKLQNANFDYARFSSRVSAIQDDSEYTFPVPALGEAKFENIYVDDVFYTRKEFFDKFQPGTDKYNKKF